MKRICCSSQLKAPKGFGLTIAEQQLAVVSHLDAKLSIVLHDVTGSEESDSFLAVLTACELVSHGSGADCKILFTVFNRDFLIETKIDDRFICLVSFSITVGLLCRLTNVKLDVFKPFKLHTALITGVVIGFPSL